MKESGYKNKLFHYCYETESQKAKKVQNSIEFIDW